MDKIEKYILKKLNSKEANKYNECGIFSEFITNLSYYVSLKFKITEYKAGKIINKVIIKNNICNI